MAPVLAQATNGYFSHGYGIKAKGMAGVGIALPQDAMAAATNPAGMAFVGNRLDLGLDIFMPRRSSEIVGNGGIPPMGVPSLDGTYSGDGSGTFFIPEFGYNRMINPNLAFGLTVYGNGGMNTRYNTSPFTNLGGSSPAGVDLIQLFVAPTLAYKVTPNHALGITLNLAYQKFSADGLEPFGMFSTDPTRMSNVGDDTSAGWGVRIGWTGRVSDTVTLGATYQTKTRMGTFDKYAGLYAQQGGFDIPANYGVGIAVRATPKLTIAADVQRIDYGSIPSIANPVQNLFNPDGSGLLGADNGAGFGWRDMTVFKLGAAYQYDDRLTLRAGYSNGRQPIPSDQTFFNIYAPGVEEDHLTLGATWQLGGNKEVSVSYMHAFKKTVNGSGSMPPMLGGGEANLRMHENAVGVAFAWRM
jgi:long-chain fatty acid transport protein